ncbi:glycosyltransferase family 4 protein [Halosimplex salinum]|uniref:glycosyltransferase family 4 protein n=1 Tax=Halosimplex salinum TaxID=1710538 RepID=UPI000F499158|nr:glycosyltransferase family 4 protein [Halosimplex salinum]
MNSIVFVTVEDLSGRNGSSIATRELIISLGEVSADSLSVICPEPRRPLPERLEASVDRFEILPPVTSPGDPKWHLREEVAVLYRLGKLILTERPSTVITRLTPSTLFPAPLCRLSGPTHVLLVRGWVNRDFGDDRTKFHSLVERIVQANVRLSDEVFVAFEALREWVCKYRTPSQSPVTVLPNAVDPELFAPGDGQTVRDRLGIDEDVFVIGFVGALAERHMLPELVRATAEDERFRALIVGDGPIRGDLEQLAADLDITNRVHFAGAVDHKRVPDYVNAFDIGYGPVSPNKTSNPIKCYEYLACEIPVITSRSPELTFVDEVGAGVLLKSVEPSTIAAAITTLREADTEDRQQMGHRGRAYVKRNHTWIRVAERILASTDTAQPHSDRLESGEKPS